jgi:hypothetical protein
MISQRIFIIRDDVRMPLSVQDGAYGYDEERSDEHPT